jgi:hypothetical protein
MLIWILRDNLNMWGSSLKYRFCQLILLTLKINLILNFRVNLRRTLRRTVSNLLMIISYVKNYNSLILRTFDFTIWLIHIIWNRFFILSKYFSISINVILLTFIQIIIYFTSMCIECGSIIELVFLILINKFLLLR